MSNLCDIYEPGDQIVTSNSEGLIFLWYVGHDGLLTLRQYPPDVKAEIPTYPPQGRP